MTKATMIKNYRKFSGAESYIIGFTYKHMLYMIKVAEIMPRYMSVQHSSSKTGRVPKLQLTINNSHKEQMIRKGAICLGSEDLIVCDDLNKGFAFERLVSEFYGIEYRGQDNVGFWVGGDLEVNGEQIQIKFQGAQIVAEKTLERLKKGLTK
jgi:hypothetical protein